MEQCHLLCSWRLHCGLYLLNSFLILLDPMPWIRSLLHLLGLLLVLIVLLFHLLVPSILLFLLLFLCLFWRLLLRSLHHLDLLLQLSSCIELLLLDRLRRLFQCPLYPNLWISSRHLLLLLVLLCRLEFYLFLGLPNIWLCLLNYHVRLLGILLGRSLLVHLVCHFLLVEQCRRQYIYIEQRELFLYRISFEDRYPNLWISSLHLLLLMELILCRLLGWHLWLHRWRWCYLSYHVHLQRSLLLRSLCLYFYLFYYQLVVFQWILFLLDQDLFCLVLSLLLFCRLFYYLYLLRNHFLDLQSQM